MPRKTTIFLSDQSREIINQIKTETGQPMTAIINDALRFYGSYNRELEAMLRRVIREEILE